MRSAPRPRSLPRAVRRTIALVAATVAGGALLVGPAQAAPPLSPSAVGEPAQGGGVFRFPQAVAVSDGGTRVFVGDQYSGVVQAFDGAGRFLFNIGSHASRDEPGRFGVVGGVAVDRTGHLYVLDSENDRVQVFAAANGQFLSEFGNSTAFNLMSGSPSAGAGISAGGIAVFQAPNTWPTVYIADEGNDRVLRIPINLNTLQPLGEPQASAVDLAAPQGLGLDASGTHLYVADDQHHRVVELDATSLAFIAAAGSFGTGAAQFQNPYDITIDSSSPPRLYATDNLNGRVQVFDAASLLYIGAVGSIGYGPGLGNLEIVRAAGSLPDAPGTPVYVADTANNRVQAFTPTGDVTAAFGIAGRSFGYVTRPRGVTFTLDGGVAVADTFDQRVALFSPDGTATDQRGLVSSGVGYTVPGPAPGQFNLPGAVAYDGGGGLWIADTGNDRVQVESPTGQVLATSPDGTFAEPRALAPSPTGMYVADGTDGTVTAMTLTSSTIAYSGLDHPAALANDPAGVLYVAEDHRIQRPDTGATIAAPGGDTWDHPSGLSFASGGTLYVAERRPGTPNGARVLRGTPDDQGGYDWDTIATEGDGPAQVIEPGGLAVNTAGSTLLVADSGNNRVLRFDAPGTTPPATRLLQVGVDQPSRGTVVSDIPGIACVSDCQQHYGGGRNVTLTARSEPGSTFLGWTGDCTSAGASPTCVIPMTADRLTVARFALIPVVAPPPAVVALKFLSAKLSTTRLHPALRANRRLHHKAAKATKSTVRIALIRQARVTVTVLSRKVGRVQGKTCRPLTKKNRGRKHCTRYTSVAGHLTIRTATTGKARFVLTTRWNKRQLRPGDYFLSFAATDTQGLKAAPITRKFRVVTR